MNPARGELYTVEPHHMYDGSKAGFLCGAFHCRVMSEPFDSRIKDGKWTGLRVVHVQEMKIVDGRWKPAMSACIEADKLRALEVQLDLFGQPAPEMSHG